MTEILSVQNYEDKKVAIIRSGMESFEIIINSIDKTTEIWKAQYKKMNGGYEKEIFPKMILKCKTKELKDKYKTPKQMIENYMMNGRI